MSTSAAKLEMSLDEIIKAQKKAGQTQFTKKAGVGMRRGPINKRRILVNPKGRRQTVIGRKHIGNQGLKNKRFITPKQLTGPIGRRTVGIAKRLGGGVRKNATIVKKIQNRAVISATKNLVKKLVKKAIAQNVVSTRVARRQKIIRIPANRLRQRTIVLNRVNARSRVIARRRNVTAKNPLVRGRGPVRFIQSDMPTTSRAIMSIPPRRRNRNTIQYIQTRPVMVQRAIPAFVPKNINNNNTQLRQAVTIREQINAMRRATRVRQLQSQFIKQEQQRQIPVFRPRRQQAQQVIQVVQQRPRPRRQQPQQYIILQQPQQQQRYRRQQFRGGQQRRQQVQFDPMFSPPNFLQRI